MANLVNLCLYQVGWFACVLGAAAQRPWLGMGLGLVLLCIHLALLRGVLRHLALIGVAGAIGLAADSVQMWWGASVTVGSRRRRAARGDQRLRVVKESL